MRARSEATIGTEAGGPAEAGALPPSPELPRSRRVGRGEIVRFDCTIEHASWSGLRDRAAAFGVAPYPVFGAAFADVLGRWARSRNFVLSMSAHEGRRGGKASSLVEFDGVPASFAERASRLGEALARADESAAFVSLDAPHTLPADAGDGFASITPYVVVWADDAASCGDERPAGIEATGDLDDAAQVLIRLTIARHDGRLILFWDAIPEAFPDGLVSAMVESFSDLLRWLATDDEPWHAHDPVRLPREQQSQRLQYNATEAPVSAALLQQLFELQVRERPDAPAIVAPGRSFTYAQLGVLAARIGRALRDAGARSGTLCAIVMDKGWEQVAAAIGILTAGAAYLPIDPAMPTERMHFILAHGGVIHVLTQARLDAALVWPEGVKSWCVDRYEEWPEAGEPLQAVQGPTDLAYVIYTSGSTGQPKGVAIDHRAAVNTILDVNERFGITAHDRVLALSSLSFDLSVYDVFGTLATGATIIMPDAAHQREPGHWLALLRRERVTIWNSVPALLQMLCEFSSDELDKIGSSLRLVWLSGDWIPIGLPDEIRALAPAAEVVSLGGATEAAIWSIVFPIGRIDPFWSSIPYGRPMRNQCLYVLDAQFQDCPVWVPGFLFIGGLGLAQGYWRDPEKTVATFVVHPRTGERLYRAGDLGRFLPDGNIEFLGRLDSQVKIQGYRIELGEVEAALQRHPFVRRATCAAQGDGAADRRLVSWILPQPGCRMPAVADMRSFLATIIPHYMIPALLVEIGEVPVTANGKVDRQALARLVPLPSRTAPEPHQQMERTVEAVIAAVWQDVLGVERVGLHDNFFDIGGQSLQLVRIYRCLRQELLPELQIGQLFDLPTVAMMASYVRTVRSGRAEGPVGRVEQPGAPVAVAHSSLPY